MKGKKHFKFLLIGALIFFSFALAVNIGHITLNQSDTTLALKEKQLAAVSTKSPIKSPCESKNADLKCRNKCITTYTVLKGKNQWGIATCSLEDEKGNPILEAVKKYTQECGSDVATVEKALCYTEQKISLKEKNTGLNSERSKKTHLLSGNGISRAAINQIYKKMPPRKRKQCAYLLQNIKRRINSEFLAADKTRADIKDAKDCKYKKPVNCVEQTSLNSTGIGHTHLRNAKETPEFKKFVCWPKKNGGKPRQGRGGDAGSGNGSTTQSPWGSGNNSFGTGSGSGNMMNPFMQGMGQGMGQGMNSGMGNAMIGNNCMPNPYINQQQRRQNQTTNGMWRSIGQGFGYLFGGLMTGQRPPLNQYCNQQQLLNNCANPVYAAHYPQACKRVQPTTCVLVANKTHIKSGEAIRLKWQTQYARSIKFESNTGVNITNNSASGEITVYPKHSGNITLKVGGDVNPYMSIPTNSCSKSVGIVVDGKTTPDEGEFPPELSCTPASIKQGESAKVQVSWNCSNGNPTSSAGFGVDTVGEISGSKDVYPTATTQYSVSCISGDKVIGKSYCTVLAENPMFKIIAWPNPVSSGERARISWGSLGMSTCRVTGPDGFAYEQRTGVVITTPFPQNSSRTEAIYTIECVDKWGSSYTKDISISKE